MSTKRQKHIILKDAFIYSAANWVSDAFGIMVSIFSKRFLGVIGAGRWTVLSVIQSYALYGSLGIKNAVYREIPQHIGAKQFERAKQTQNAAFSYVLISGVAGALLIWFLSVTFFKDRSLKWGMMVIGFLVLLTQIYNLLLTLLRAHKRFSVLGKVIVLNTILILILALAGAYFYNVVGYAIGLILASSISLFWGKKWGQISFQLSFKWKDIGSLVAIGLPMVAASFLFRTFLNMDTILIGKMLGAQSLGLYTIGLMTVQQISAFPKFFNTALFPYVQEKFGETKVVKDIRSLVIKPTEVYSRILPFFLGLSIFFVEGLTHYVLPQFRGGLEAMKILVFGYYFVILSEMASTLLFTINKQNLLVILYSAFVGVITLLNYVMISSGFGIQGVAVGSAISYFLFFLVLSGFAWKFILGKKEIVHFYRQIACYYLYFLFNVGWIDRLFNFRNVLISVLLKSGVLSLISIPVFVILERREKIISLCFDIVKSKFKPHGVEIEPV